jgi:hypothetical protein
MLDQKRVLELHGPAPRLHSSPQNLTTLAYVLAIQVLGVSERAQC